MSGFLGINFGQFAVGVGSSSPVRWTAGTLQIYIGELHQVVILTDTDLSGETIYIEFDNLRGTSVDTIADGSITKTEADLTFTVTAALSSTARTMRYAVRDTTTHEVFAYGIAVCGYQPLDS